MRDTKVQSEKMLYSNGDLKKLIIPLIIEQTLGDRRRHGGYDHGIRGGRGRGFRRIAGGYGKHPTHQCFLRPGDGRGRGRRALSGAEA